MDIVTRQYFKNFLKEYELIGGETDKNFEKFVDYILLSTKNINDFELSSTVVGDGDDCGIDGFAIAINNRFINSKSELDEIIKMNIQLEASVYYIQTKMSASFDGSEMLTFGTGVVDTLRKSSKAKKRRNSKISEKCEMIQVIVENYQLFSSGVNCELYYVTTGKWVDDQNLLGDIETIVQSVEDTSFFSSAPQFIPMGSNEIRKTYELTKVQNHAEFIFKDKIELPYMETIEESYLGIMPVKDYLRIIADEDRRIKSGIFELNVRDFQGVDDNRVNQDIENTIFSDEKGYFGFYNNGVTIVGKSLTKLQGKFNIKNFYVVNGCQTSNVLNKYYSELNDDMWIGIKIVITNNEKLIQSIVKATNNQTVVEAIQFQSFEEFQAILESYFECQEYYRLYYERRKGQYNTHEQIILNHIITPQIAIKSFASIFQESPHKASRFYGTLEEEIGDKIFLPNHDPILYFSSSLVYVILDNYIINDKLPDQYHKFRYFIMTLLSRSVLKDIKRPQFNSKKIEEYCEILIKAVLNEAEFESLINEVINIIDRVVTDIKNTETTKSIAVFQSMCLFQDLNITEDNLKSIQKYLSTMDYYLIPFRNMRLDGDLRYNFKDRLWDLYNRLNAFGLKSTAKKINLFDEIDDSKRQERKEASNEIVEIIEKNSEYNAGLLDKAQKYIKIDRIETASP